MATVSSSSFCGSRSSISPPHSSSSTRPILLSPNPLHFSIPNFNPKKKTSSSHHCKTKLRVSAVTEGSAKKSSKEEDEKDQSVPSWAQPGSDEPPPWAKNESQKDSSGFEVPFFVYLLASAITAIAAIGSVFEYVNQKPVFGVLSSDSVFYAPLLGFFAFTGIPSSAFLWYKSVQVANKEAEEQDKRDGYR